MKGKQIKNSKQKNKQTILKIKQTKKTRKQKN